MAFKFVDHLTPRIADLNYGGHVGHTELINLLHETRLRFLSQYGLDELDIQGCALVMRQISVTYTNQVFWRDQLKIELQVRTEGVKVIFAYVMLNGTRNNQALTAEAQMVLLDKQKQRPVKPSILLETIAI